MYDVHPSFVTHWLAALRPEGPKGCTMTSWVRDALAVGPADRIVRGDSPLVEKAQLRCGLD